MFYILDCINIRDFFLSQKNKAKLVQTCIFFVAQTFYRTKKTKILCHEKKSGSKLCTCVAICYDFQTEMIRIILILILLYATIGINKDIETTINYLKLLYKQQ